MGELHLEVLVDAHAARIPCASARRPSQVAYRESITGRSKKRISLCKADWRHGQYGHVVFEIEPASQAAVLSFKNDIVGGVIPKEFIPGVEKGVREAAEGGVLAGYPVTDIKVRLYDGSFHEVDSNEMLFKNGGFLCPSRRTAKSRPVLLEPIMKVEVVVSEEFLGDIIGQMTGRRGLIRVWKSDPVMPRRCTPWCR